MRQVIYTKNLSQFYAVSKSLEGKAVWLGYDEVSWRRHRAIKEMWEAEDGLRVIVVLRLPKAKHKRLLEH